MEEAVELRLPKMRLTNKDPRTYVSPVGLPISQQKGLKIQARSAEVYNPQFPARDVVRRENYHRRLEQMANQGFRSVNYKPYEGIGDPFYLEEEKLILHALGQIDPSQVEEPSSRPVEDDRIPEPIESVIQSRPITAAKFVLRRTRKDLNTLPQEVNHGRTMIRNVKLGHGLFDMLKQERIARKAAAEKEHKQKMYALRTEWQPPKYDSSSEDETDEDLDDDVDLARFMLPGSENARTSTATSRPDKSRVAFSRLDLDYDDSKPITPRVSSGNLHRKKHPQVPRPYTPQLNNIAEPTESISEQSLFRQLCALYWLLEAMNVEANQAMSPITTCWNLLEIGGSRTSIKKLQKEKIMETKWDNFVTNTQLPRSTKRQSSSRIMKAFRRTRRNSSITPVSSAGRMHTPDRGDGSVRGLDSQPTSARAPDSPLTTTRVEAIPEDAVLSSQNTDDEDGGTTVRSPFKYPDDNGDILKSVSPEDINNNNQPEVPPGGRDSVISTRAPHRSDSRMFRKNFRMSEDVLSQPPRRESRIQSARAYDELPNTLRAGSVMRPKSSPALLEYKASLPSRKHESLPVELRQKFAGVKEEQALILHEKLEQKERMRLKLCQNKFLVMRSQESGVHRALENLRSKSAAMMSVPSAGQKKRLSLHINWFEELCECIPMKLQELWYYERIFYELAKYGQNEGLRNQSAFKFLKVLEGLREWEICSPDISAAVEFCRDKIVEMTIDEYEEWFRQRFPMVTRPQTAPPASKRESHSRSEVVRHSVSAKSRR